MDSNKENISVEEIETYFRSSYIFIPENYLETIKDIPLTLSVEFDRMKQQICEDQLVRCSECSGYLNCYCEVFQPGYKWRCCLCQSVNELIHPLPYDHDKKSFSSDFMNSHIYEIEAPSNFSFKTPDPPILVFLIEVTVESKDNNLLLSVLNCIREALDENDFEERTRVSFMFYNSNVYVLTTEMNMLVIGEETPKILSDSICFSTKKDQENNIFSICFDEITDYFKGVQVTYNNILVGISTASQIFRSGTIYTFMSSPPNFGKSIPTVSYKELFPVSPNFKNAAVNLLKKNLALNIFVCTKMSVELGAFRSLTASGGQVIHYSNYNGSDPVYTSKLFSDLQSILSSNYSFGGYLKIRMSEKIKLKAIHGNFFVKNDLFRYLNFYPSHAINFEVDITGPIDRFFVQLAMIRTLKSGLRTIRVFTINIPFQKSGHGEVEMLNVRQLAASLAFQASFEESIEKTRGLSFLKSKYPKLYSAIKRCHGGLFPDYIRPLTVSSLALCKSVAFRPHSSTPNDFKSYYLYLFCNMNFAVIDPIISPVLINLCDPEPVQYNLSFANISSTGLYLMNAGIIIFLYVGSENNEISELFIDHTNITSGLSTFDNINAQSEIGEYFNSLLSYFTAEMPLIPRFYVVLEHEKDHFYEIFKTYFYEDSKFGLPDIFAYENSLQ